MQHLKNIQTLFSKNFVENPLLETFEVGKLHLSSGYLVANDPLLTPDKQAFTVKFPIGDFTTFIHKERESNCIAYAEVVFASQEVDYWEMAVCEGQNIKDLKDEEIFGYPVESGMGCFMDLDSQNLLNNLEIELFEKKGKDFLGIYEEFFHQHFYDENGAIDQFAFLKPYDNKPNNIFAFETGFGEGFYACYIGFDEQKNPVKIIAEFIEVKSE